MVLNKKNWLICILIFYYLISGFIFSFLIPPFQKPDAYRHFKKVVSLANFDFSCQIKKQKIRKDFLFLFENSSIKSIPFNKSGKVPSSIYKLPVKNAKAYIDVSTGCRQYHDNIGYFIPVVVYKFFENLPVNAAILLALMRFVIFLISYFFILLVILKTKNFFIKYLILFILSLPMTIYQLSSFSYDVGHLVFGLIFISLFFNFLDKEKPQLKDFFNLTFFFYLFIFSKPLYEFFFLSLFLLPQEKWNKLKIKKWLFLLVVFFSIFIFRFFSYQSAGVNLGRFDSKIQREIFWENPSRFFLILKETFFKRFQFYIESFIGFFGWVDFSLEYFVYTFFLVGYGILIGCYFKKVKISQSQFIVYFLIFLLTFFSIIVGEFLYWTSPGDSIVIGVQGRYLIVLFPFFTLSLIYLIQNYLFPLIIITFIFLITLNIRSIYYRYFDYSVYAKSTKNLLLSKKPYILIKPKSEKIFVINEKISGACYGVFLKFKNENFDAPLKLEIYDKKRKQIVYILNEQINNSKESVGVSFSKTRFQPPVFVKVINKYSLRPVVILDDVALNCIQDPIKFFNREKSWFTTIYLQ